MSQQTLINARVERDSIWAGRRISTVVMTYPRFIHAEIMTHRMSARNAASSRAIPWPKMMERIQNDPVIPIKWGAEKGGMQTGGEIENILAAEQVWLDARDNAIHAAMELAELGVHKSIVNRLTEPFMWITVVYTATEWANLFRLRYHADAEVHFQQLAFELHEALSCSEPVERQVHAPFLTAEEEQDLANEWSVALYNDKIGAPWESMSADGVTLANRGAARNARVSYETHDGVPDPEKDDALAARLLNGSGFGHHSPFEHIAFNGHTDREQFYGPFIGWQSWRSMRPHENLPGHLAELKAAVPELPTLTIPQG